MAVLADINEDAGNLGDAGYGWGHQQYLVVHQLYLPNKHLWVISCVSSGPGPRTAFPLIFMQ